MRVTSLTLSTLFLLAAACSTSSDRSIASAPDRPALRSSGVPDLIGSVDLTVDAKATQNNWIVRVEDLPANFCSVEEGGITPGEHTLIRFTVTTPNIGDADNFIGSPLKHWDPNGDGDPSDSDGLFEFATCHNHFHFRNYTDYKLIDADGKVWKAAKRGFCMLDTDPFNTKTGDGTWTYRRCGTKTVDGFQGISTGWADSYVWKLGGQYFLLDGGDGQAIVPPGVYTIRIEVNPPFAPDNKGNCPRFKDPAGSCRQFLESDYTNNVGTATVIITDHPGRSGYGPLKNNADKITADDDIDHKGK